MKGINWSRTAKYLFLSAPLMFGSLVVHAQNTYGTVELQPVQDEKIRTQAEIDTLNTKIKQAQSQLKKLNALASSTERKLGQAQSALSENRRQKLQIVTAMNTLKQDIASTEQSITDARDKLIQHKTWIEEQLVQNYKHGQDNALKLVLSGQSPSDTTRLLRYHQTIHTTRHQRMQEIQRQQEFLAGLRAQQRDSQQKLTAKQTELAKIEKQQISLRQTLLTSQKNAQNSIRKTKTSVSDMQKQTRLLESLLQDLILQEELAQSKTPSEFAKMKGLLPKPLAGRFENLYNQGKRNGNGRWRGAWIIPEGNDGQDVAVNSIAAGHVVYADWLLGYGLLTIIDHGQGFFTLYGHSQTLLRAPGDYVAAGTPIAFVSTQARADQAIKGLYFEIRENTQALNPVSWLKVKQ